MPILKIRARIIVAELIIKLIIMIARAKTIINPYTMKMKTTMTTTMVIMTNISIAAITTTAISTNITAPEVRVTPTMPTKLVVTRENAK